MVLSYCYLSLESKGLLRPYYYLGKRGIGEVGPLDYPMNLGSSTCSKMSALEKLLEAPQRPPSGFGEKGGGEERNTSMVSVTLCWYQRGTFRRIK